jgi:hypothetical protein
MSVINSVITDEYALYRGDCVEVASQMPDKSVHLSVYSPPFAGLYHYSSDERDMSNCRNRDEFFEHYGFLVEQIARITMPGRITAVHCMDVPQPGGSLFDLPGAIVKLHEAHGLKFVARHAVWKEPLAVRMRTMAKGLAHRQVVEDSTLCDVASADYLLLFRAPGENTIPVEHPRGLMHYAGSRSMPADILPFRGHEGHHTENRFSHWIWRNYASAFWDDVRIDRVLPFREARDEDDEKHVHPLQLDVIERVVILRSNPGETVFTPFMGVGSEVYGAVINGRKGVGVELKDSYFVQATRNMEAALRDREMEQAPLFVMAGGGDEDVTAPKLTANPNTWKKK